MPHRGCGRRWPRWTIPRPGRVCWLSALCSAPVGGYARIDEPGYWEPEIFLRGGVFGGSDAVRMSITGTAAAAAELGRELAASLLAAGAAALMTESRL